MRNRSQKGFTLIELLIVIAIIGILAAVLIPNLLNARARAYDSGAQNCANSIQTAQEVYWIDFDTYAGSYALLTAEGNTASSCAGIIAAAGTVTTVGTDTGHSGTVEDPRGTQTYTVTDFELTGVPQVD